MVKLASAAMATVVAAAVHAADIGQERWSKWVR